MSTGSALRRCRTIQPPTTKAKSYGLVDATAWWKPEQLKGFSIQAGVYNIFDETYYDAVSLRDVTMSQPEAFYSEPGRTFKVSITQRF